MLRVIAIAAILVVSTAVAMTVEEQWYAFRIKYQKHYTTAQEEQKRFAIFQANMKKAESIQKVNPEAQFGMTPFSDLSEEEFKVRHNAEKYTAQRKSATKNYPTPYNSAELQSKPSEVDWRKHGAVTPIKNQAQCGSCWAFSTTGNIEGQWFLAGNKLVSLSEQELVSCDTGSDGCGGGYTGGAMSWLVQNQDGWITSEKDYPYVSGQGQNPACALPKPKAAQIYGHHTLPSNEEQMAAYMAEHGPLSICVDASTWQSYQGGVMTNCPTYGVDHCVLIVGYNFNAATKYWIVKNSWGTSWGLDGYLHIAYGSNQCDLTSTPNNALVKHVGPTTAAPPPTPVPPPTPAPPTPPTPPVTPAPAGQTFTQYWCPDFFCNTGCTKHVFEQGKCLVNPTGASVKSHCTETALVVKVWLESKTCAGQWYEDQEPLDQCLRADGGDYIYNTCPKSARLAGMFEGGKATPQSFGNTADLPKKVQQHIDRAIQRARDAAKSH